MAAAGWGGYDTLSLSLPPSLSLSQCSLLFSLSLSHSLSFSLSVFLSVSLSLSLPHSRR